MLVDVAQPVLDGSGAAGASVWRAPDQPGTTTMSGSGTSARVASATRARLRVSQRTGPRCSATKTVSASGSRLSDLVGADGVEGGQVVVQEDRDLHAPMVGLRGAALHRARHLRSRAGVRRRRVAGRRRRPRPRVVTPSLRRMLETWTLAVFSDTYSSVPIWRLVCPAATRASTSASRGVSPSRVHVVVVEHGHGDVDVDPVPTPGRRYRRAAARVGRRPRGRRAAR